MASVSMTANVNPEPTKRYRISINDDDPNPERELLPQLKAIPKDAEALTIDNNVPSDSDWAALGDHFTSIRDLKLHAGWNEELNDEKLPLHWPLERLFFADSCGETFRSPWVLEGRVKHLILLGTAGLRFEGPTTSELIEANREAIARGEREKETITVRKDTPDERQIEINFVPDLVQGWMRDKYAEKPQVEYDATESRPKPPPMQLQTLEIIENDALDAFSRFVLANADRGADPSNLTTLVLRSTNGYDFGQTAPQMFRQILPQMTELKTLVLTVGEKTFQKWEEGGEDEKEEEKNSGTASRNAGQEAGKEEEATVEKIPTSTESTNKKNSEEGTSSLLTTLYTSLPPTLQCLRFRGPASLTASPAWPHWVATFSSPTFLPDLKTLSFVLDLDVGGDGLKKEKGSERELGEAELKEKEKEKVETETEALRKAKRECERLWEGASTRGVEVEAFRDHWIEEWPRMITDVDPRWAGL